MEAIDHWINDYLDTPASPEEQAELLTQAGFPLENRIDLPNGWVKQDFEMTSNRGDCACHIGLAREIAALSNRNLLLPDSTLEESKNSIQELLSIDNKDTLGCPRYLAKYIENVSFKQSPQKIKDRIEARGDISRGNMVDATNYLLFEMGHPTHVFDYDKIEGGIIVIRKAIPGEKLLPLGENANAITLTKEDLIIADKEKPIALAGIKGGQAASVTSSTTRIILECATFNPALIKNSSRRHKIQSDSSWRFERGIDPRALDAAMNRLAHLILKTTGGTLYSGTLESGSRLKPKQKVSMRMNKCRELIGTMASDATIETGLKKLDLKPSREGNLLHCTIPFHRLDLEREIDLIEEVVRIIGYESLPEKNIMTFKPIPPNPIISARQHIDNFLISEKFIECVTHSLIENKTASLFLNNKTKPWSLKNSEQRGEDALRPSILASLLQVRKYNADASAGKEKNIRLYERGCCWKPKGSSFEEIHTTGLLIDAPEEKTTGLRQIKGTVEQIFKLLLPNNSTITMEPTNEIPWASTGIKISLENTTLGLIGPIKKILIDNFNLKNKIHGAELFLSELETQWPPKRTAKKIHSYPSIERDLTFLFEEEIQWDDILKTTKENSTKFLEEIKFVTVFRDKKFNNKKSLTMKLVFRALDRTLAHEEIDESITITINSISKKHEGILRS